MEGKLITTTGLKAYTQQLKTWLGDTYQTKADMALYTKTADLSKYLDTKYIAINSSLYGNPIYKHIVTVVSTPGFILHLTIFTTRATRYKTSSEFKTDWVDNRTIISVLADAINYSAATTVFKGTVIEEDDSYYLKCYIPISETKYITLNDTLTTDKKTYKYSIKSISEEYFSDKNDTYQEVVLNINLDNKYRYNNLVLNLKLLKEDKMVIEYLKELGGTKWLN